MEIKFNANEIKEEIPDHIILQNITDCDNPIETVRIKVEDSSEELHHSIDIKEEIEEFIKPPIPDLTCNITNLFICGICDTKFKSKTSLAEHLSTHTEVKPLNSEVYDFKSLHNNYSSKQHICKICGYRSTRKSSLREHLRSHTGDKPISCNICDFKTAYRSNLDKHLRIHSGEKRFACKFCDYKSVIKANLQEHLRIHTDEKPYVCSVCNYKTAHASSFRRHTQVHTKEKPYACDICDYKTARKEHFRDHLNIHTGEKPFACEICEYKSSRKSDLQKHIKTHNLLTGILTQTLKSKNSATDLDKQQFDLLYPTLVQDIINQHSNNGNFNKCFSDMLISNLPKEKQLSGLAVLKGYKMFKLQENQSMENIVLASVLGWCVNLLLTSYSIITDITNRTNDHWCQDKGAEIEAVHHALLIEKSVFLILKKYFSDHECYQEILRLFHKVNFNFAMGLKLDAMYRSQKKIQLEDFKMETYKKIVKYTSSYPFLALPMLLALYCSENSNVKVHSEVKTFLFALGEFLATQDAVINCFGNDLDLNASKFSDISTGKCNWLIVEALKRATENQKHLLRENYGRTDLENQILVYNIYNDIGLFDIFLGYSEENFYNICEKILAMSKILPSQYFIQLVEISFGRTM